MTPGEKFIQHLIADYENAASYWRVYAYGLQEWLQKYKYMPEEIEATQEEIVFALRTVEEMEANAAQLRGGKGEPESDPISQLPVRHTEQLQKITCTTVL